MYEGKNIVTVCEYGIAYKQLFNVRVDNFVVKTMMISYGTLCVNDLM